MGELEERLDAVLNDPGQMERIMRMANTLMGSMGGGGTAGGKPSPGGSAKKELVNALSPWLSPERQRRLTRALRVAAAAKLASSAMRDMGGDGDESL